MAMLQQRLDRQVGNWQHARRMRRMSELFAGQEKSLPDVPTFFVGSRMLHAPESLEMFADLETDILLVSHAPLLKPEVFEQPKLATLNIHWGIAPHYCGEHTLFWPLYYRDYANLGITIHRIDQGIDTGPILAQGYPGVFPDDGEAELMARSAGMAASLVCDLLDAAQAGDPLQGKISSEPCRLFLKRDRHAIQDLRYWTRRRIFRETLPTLEPRREQQFQPIESNLLTVVSPAEI